MDLYRNHRRGLSEMTIFKRILKFTESCLSQRLAALSLVLTFLLVLPLITGLSTPVFITTPASDDGRVCVYVFERFNQLFGSLLVSSTNEIKDEINGV